MMHEPRVSEVSPGDWVAFCACGWQTEPCESQDEALMMWELDHEW